MKWFFQRLILAVIVAGCLGAVSSLRVSAQAMQTITLDGSAAGRSFEGLGAISGGGNTTRLLPDYPKAERQQILDYLFKPQFGASLNALKVEVGGDINSTEGSEPSHMHTRNDQNYQRGFEWWLMEQAKDRNPKITLDCLAWGAPGWVGNGNYWSQDMMDYYINWIKGAKRDHHLTINSVGGKNESGYNAAWYEQFRKELDANGLSKVLLVGSDDWGPPWLNMAKQAVTDPKLAQAINVFAGHVTWSENPGVAPASVLNLGKPLWDSEAHDYVAGDYNKEVALVHIFNINYIKTKIVKTLVWNLIWSYYPISNYPDVGMMQANTPWSGHYVVQPEVWGYAHINQFIQPGWHYLGNGGCGRLPGGGTYTSLKSPDGSDYSVILETGDAKAPQVIHFQTQGGLSVHPLHVWQSSPSAQFVRLENITPVDGSFQITLDPDCIYSLSTRGGQKKGEYPAPPPDHPFPFPYTDTFQEYLPNSQARYLFDYEGCFESEKKILGPGNCLTQDATASKSGWGGAYLPLTFLGSPQWSDYTISVNAYIEHAGAVSLHGRIGTIPGGNANDPPGYTFRIRSSGDWDLKSGKTILDHGTTAFSADQWHPLGLRFLGSQITGFVGGHAVFTVNDTTYSHGLAGLGSGWNFAQFSDLKIEPDGQ